MSEVSVLRDEVAALRKEVAELRALLVLDLNIARPAMPVYSPNTAARPIMPDWYVTSGLSKDGVG